jgi:hypothetical protein
MKQSSYIDPFETKDVRYWTRKWDVTPTELYNAIFDTGSNNINILKQNLQSKGMYLFPMGKMIHDIFLKFK